MKKTMLVMASALLAASCSTTVNKDQVAATYQENLKGAHKAGSGSDVDFHGGKFKKYYSGEKALKKMAIVSVSYGLGATRSVGELTREGRFKNLVEANKKENVANTVYESVKKHLEQTAGYEIMSPSELAEKSETFKKTKMIASEWSGAGGITYAGNGIVGSRDVGRVTHEGKLISTIAQEAGIDGVIYVYLNEVNDTAKEGYYNGVDILGFKREASLAINVCVPREKAKNDGASLGWFGDANLCATALTTNKHFVYLPDPKTKDAQATEVKDLLAMSSDYQKNYIDTLVNSTVKEMKEEGL